MEEANYKIGVEARLTKVETKLDELMTNHLVHLDAKVDRITWMLIASLAALTFDLIKGFILK